MKHLHISVFILVEEPLNITSFLFVVAFRDLGFVK